MSREEAIDLLDNLIGMVEDNHQSNYDTALQMAIKVLEQEPSGDAVSRQELLKQMGEEPFNWTDTDKELQEVEDYRYFKNMVEQLPSVNPQKWIPIEWKPFGKHGYPKPEDEYKHFLTVDNKGEITIQEFLLTLDEEPQPYFTGMRNVIAWMPLPAPYDPQESEVNNG